MGVILVVLGALALVLAAVAVWMRIMPEAADRFHAWPAGETRREWTEPGGYGRVVRVTGPEAFAEFDRIIRATPRTEWVAGSVDKGRVTYITRSAVFGFPDYATVEYRAGDTPEIAIYSRLRVGKSDLGVNKARVLGWLAALKQAGFLAEP